MIVRDLGGQRIGACLGDLAGQACLAWREAGFDAEVEAAQVGILKQKLLLERQVVHVERDGDALPQAVRQVRSAVVTRLGQLDPGQFPFDRLHNKDAVSDGLVRDHRAELISRVDVKQRDLAPDFFKILKPTGRSRNRAVTRRTNGSSRTELPMTFTPRSRNHVSPGEYSPLTGGGPGGMGMLGGGGAKGSIGSRLGAAPRRSGKKSSVNCCSERPRGKVASPGWAAVGPAARQ